MAHFIAGEALMFLLKLEMPLCQDEKKTRPDANWGCIMLSSPMSTDGPGFAYGS